MKRFVEGEDRRQGVLLPEYLDDFVAEENQVRVIEAFVDALDLAALGFEGATPAATGRPSYHPAVLLKIYVYGYINQIGSSRRLERGGLARRNVELMWLTGRLAPDFKTIADFRRDNGPAIRATCRQFIAVCRRLNLFAHAVAPIDGSKFKAVNARDKNFTRAKLQKRMDQVEASIERYMAALERADRQEGDIARAKSSRLKDKIAALREQMAAFKNLEPVLRAAPDEQISLTDPDARSMATSGRGRGIVGYNVQIAADAELHLVVAHEVTNVGHDREQLSSMAGISKATTIEETTIEDFDKLFAVNVRAPFFLVQQLLPILSKGSSIVFVSSLAARAVVGAIPAYAATKGAIETMTKHFASLLGERGVRVNAVAPGVVETDMSNFTKTDAGRDLALGMQAFKRLAQPDDIGGVVAFLASDHARWITGDTLHVDGGSKL